MARLRDLPSTGERVGAGLGRLPLFLLLAVPGLLTGLLLLPRPAAAAGHPRLVSAESTACMNCHEDLFGDRVSVHAPALDDCSMCHDVSVTADGTEISLTTDGPDLCLMCHDDLAGAAGGEWQMPHFPVTDSCTTCHDPHASRDAPLLASPLTELCAACHDLADLAESHDGQITEKTDCRNCHLPHGSEGETMLIAGRLHAPFEDGSCQACHRPPMGTRIRLRARGERLCTSCHADLAPAKDPEGSVHAALKGERGRAGCLACHDPHLARQAGLLLEPGPALCEGCHGEIVAASAAESGHAPAADDCIACHQPHVSDRRLLLNAPVADLCQSCHDVEDEELIASHLGAGLDGLDCTSCHSPHGTGNGSLLAANLHAPVADGCDMCHEGSFDAVMEGGESALCLMCHDDIGVAASEAAAPHAAMEVARCADCHNPHASPQEKLIRLPAGGVCLDCHGDQAAGEGEQLHEVIRLIGCRACHEPHGGGQEKLLRVTGPALCLSCHDPNRVSGGGDNPVRVMGRFDVPPETVRRMATLHLTAGGQEGHPIPGHRVLGEPTPDELKRGRITFKGEMTCLTCHDPHKGRSGGLLRWNAATSTEACAQCHQR